MSSSPTKILIIRHGEKPGDPATDNADDGRDLSPRGFERAAALAVYVPNTFAPPDFLFATEESKHSNRPVETITPLAKALGIEINSKHADDDFQKVADDIRNNAKYAGKLVLICWHHGKIPKLTAALGGSPPFDPWPGTVFDRVWSLDLPVPAGAAGLPVQNISQMLLFGDSST
jgi:phosphohistidine phosphatase SixA